MGVFALVCLKPPGCCYHLRSFSSPLLLLLNQQLHLAPALALSLEKRPRRKHGNVITEEVLAPVPPIPALLRVLRRVHQEPAITLQMGLLRVLLEGAGTAGTSAAGAGSAVVEASQGQSSTQDPRSLLVLVRLGLPQDQESLEAAATVTTDAPTVEVARSLLAEPWVPVSRETLAAAAVELQDNARTATKLSTAKLSSTIYITLNRKYVSSSINYLLKMM